MQTIQSSNYAIYFNEKGYSYLNNELKISKYSKVFILCDSHTYEYCLPYFLSLLETDIPLEIIEIEPGESQKTIETCVQLWNALSELGGDRKSVLISLGGGVLTDIGGFVACTFKRGIEFIHIPTTLLAMVDAAVGGKNGVDLGHLKNQIGVISNPKAVLMDTQFLETLPPQQMRSGFAEMLKHGLIADQTYWETLQNFSELTTSNLDELIYRSVEIKNTIVLMDPTENGIRKALNFGHTLGHAIESYLLENPERSLLHGEAIAVGMVLESYISLKKNKISYDDYIEIKEFIHSVFGRFSFSHSDIENIIKLLIHDKKNEYGTIQFVLLNGIGTVTYNEQVPDSFLWEAFEDYKR